MYIDTVSHQIDHSTLWLTVVGVNWLTSCQWLTSELFSILENKLIGYADDSTLIAVVPSPVVPQL